MPDTELPPVIFLTADPRDAKRLETSIILDRKSADPEADVARELELLGGSRVVTLFSYEEVANLDVISLFAFGRSLKDEGDWLWNGADAVVRGEKADHADVRGFAESIRRMQSPVMSAAAEELHNVGKRLREKARK